MSSGMIFRAALMGAAVTLAGSMLAPSARADTQYLLTETNLSGFPGPYGTVDVALVDATHATVTFISGVVGGNIYLFGDGSSVAVNVNAASWTLGTITGSNAGTGFTSGGPFTNGGA